MAARGRTRTTSSGSTPPRPPNLSNTSKSIDDESLDSMLDILRQPSLTIEDARDIKLILKAASKPWLSRLLRANGLHLLSAQLLIFHTNGEGQEVSGAVQIQYELLLAIKCAMNSQTGLDIMINEIDLISSLVLNIDSSDSVVCTQTLELLAVLMVSGDGGSKSVLDALDFFKLVKRERVRFQSLVDVLFSPDSLISFKRDILFFLNTVVNTSIVLEDRLEVRADLVYAGILPAIDKLKMLCFNELGKDVSEDCSSEIAKRIEELHELESQLQVFETVLQRDISECITDLENTFDNAEVDLSDPEQIFQSLHATTVEQECFNPFLSTLQTLLLIPSYDVFGKKQWILVEDVIKRVVRGTMDELEGESLEKSAMTTMLQDTKQSLVWKERLEELSHQVDMLASRCQTLEDEEAVLKNEIQELRSRESSLQFLRMDESARFSKEMENQRIYDDQILSNEIEGFNPMRGPPSTQTAQKAAFNQISLNATSGGVMGNDLTLEELQTRILQLSTQLQRMKASDSPPGDVISRTSDSYAEPSPVKQMNTEVSFQNKSPQQKISEKSAVASNRLIPLAPPLPTVFHLNYSSVSGKDRSYDLYFAPPLPFDDVTDDVLSSKKSKKLVVRPNVPMRSLFWTRIPDNIIKFTLWDKLSDENVELNLPKLEQQFCKVAIARGESEEGGVKELKPEKKEKAKDISLLDSKVQQNVGIALAKFRMPSNEICRAIIQMDSSRLDLEKLMSLRALAPSADDLSVLKEYDGDVENLGRVERFFLHVNDIPRYVPRLDCFIFMRKFQILVSEMYHQYDIVNRALDQLDSSSSFRKVLEVVLALGNYLNGSTPRGGLYGFKLEGLLKLSTVKSVDNKMTLMHFLVKQCKSIDATILGLKDELSMCEDASRISLDTCKSEIASLSHNLKTVDDLIAAQLEDKNADENDRLVEVLSPFREEAATEIVKIEDEFNSVRVRFLKTVAIFGGADDQYTSLSFFGVISDFINGFVKAVREIEKRRLMKDKLERKKVAEEKARKARRDKKNGISDAETLIDDVFCALKGKKADEIIDSLKSTSPMSRRPRNSKRRIGVRASRRRVGAAEEFNIDDDDVLAAMMLKLGVESKPNRNGSKIESTTPVGTPAGERPKKRPQKIENISTPTGSAPSRKAFDRPKHLQPTLSSVEKSNKALSPKLSLERQRSHSGGSNVNVISRRKKDSPGSKEDDELLSFLNRKKGSK